MEQNNYLQQMEYISRKIRRLQAEAQQSTNLRKFVLSTSHRVKYWQGQTKIDNRLKNKVVNGGQSSKYQFKRTSIGSGSSTSAKAQKSSKNDFAPLAPVLAAKISSVKKVVSKAPSKCYVNPHFRQESVDNNTGDINGKIKFKQNPAAPIKLRTEKKDAIDLPSSSNIAHTKMPVPSMPTKVSLNDKSTATLMHEKADVPLPKASSTPKMKVHVNRLVYPSNDDAKARVLVNPKIFARLKSEIKRESPPRLATPGNRSKVKFSNSSGKKPFVAVGRNKLVRIRKLSFQVTPPRVRSLSTSKSLSSLTKVAKSVCSKYKFIRSGSTSTKTFPKSLKKLSPFVRTQYKLDRRLNGSQRRYKDVKKYSLKYASPVARVAENNLQGVMMHKRLSLGSKSSFGNRVWAHNKSFQPTRVIITDRKLFKIGSCSTPLAKKVRRSPQFSTLLRIGGVLYKSSRNSLARSKNDSKLDSTPKRRLNASVTKEDRKRLKTAGGHVVHVRGYKFLMDPTGKTLKRISDSSVQQKGHLSRVDLGGATFIQKSANVLIRTNNHVVRSLLSQAKQRSIFTLSTQTQKNNTVCKFFRRFGKCHRHERNKCPCVHDKKHVAICKSHLLKECTKPECLLSHDLIPEKMATCEHFLQLNCTRPNCPYLHIKLNSKAPLCIAFLQGYCADGLSCRRWHFNICPLFDKTGRCPKGKLCPYPHAPRRHVELNTEHMEFDVERIMRLYEERADPSNARASVVRYFDVARSPDSLCTVDGEDEDSQWKCAALAERKPVGFLPAFISLS